MMWPLFRTGGLGENAATFNQGGAPWLILWKPLPLNAMICLSPNPDPLAG